MLKIYHKVVFNTTNNIRTQYAYKGNTTKRDQEFKNPYLSRGNDWEIKSFEKIVSNTTNDICKGKSLDWCLRVKNNSYISMYFRTYNSQDQMTDKLNCFYYQQHTKKIIIWEAFKGWKTNPYVSSNWLITWKIMRNVSNTTKNIFKEELFGTCLRDERKQFLCNKNLYLSKAIDWQVKNLGEACFQYYQHHI